MKHSDLAAIIIINLLLIGLLLLGHILSINICDVQLVFPLPDFKLVNLKWKNQNERQQAFIRDQRIASQEHRYRQKLRQCPNYRVKARCFYEKRKGIITEKQERIPIGANKLSYSWIYMIGYWFCLQMESPSSLVPAIGMSAFLMTLQTGL